MFKDSHLLRDPIKNKGLIYSQNERERYGLHGLLPYATLTLAEEVERSYLFFRTLPDNFARSLYLSELQNNNTTLFYRLVLDHLDEMMPLIYTPMVGEIAQQFSKIYRYPRGLYITYPLRQQMEQLFENLALQEVDVIVVTDGERVLGLGDLGIGGMAICIGKLALYSLLGGIHPSRTLPIMLDVGTNREELLRDPHYIGWSHPRIRGEEYDNFLEQFVQIVKKKYPTVLLQWEDFAKEHARPLLERYRQTICSFNDDMQGTSAVTFAGIMTAAKRSKRELTEHRFVIVGAGTAGVGIAEQLLRALVDQGMAEKEALSHIYLVDRGGLLHESDPAIDENQRKFAWDKKNKKCRNLLEVVRFAEPTVLIGVSGQPNLFTREIVDIMRQTTSHPIIFPLSNPLSCTEADPKALLEWTGGDAIIATGSPFGNVVCQGKSYSIPQCNNANIFPGVGLGVISVKARTVSDEMFFAATRALSRGVSQEGEELFPPFRQIRTISHNIAVEVAKTARDQGLCAAYSDEEILEAVNGNMWTPS